jgi:hypothetical protein
VFGDHGVLDHRFGGLEQIVDAARADRLELRTISTTGPSSMPALRAI